MVKKGNRNHKVWISQQGSGLEKRQCTLQVCVRPIGPQPKLTIIFRGKGKRVTQDEREAWHKDVDVFFQENAWADTEFSVNWVQKTLSATVKDEERFVLFCDNLTAQTSDSFKEEVSHTSGVCWFGLPNSTDLWQPVDAGYAELLKALEKQAQNDWLDKDADRWYGNEKGFTSKDRKILITHWAGNANNKLISEQYNSFRWRLFEKTGCLMTADGTNDHKISPEGLPNYVIPPPLTYVEPTTVGPVSNTVPETQSEQVDEEMETEEEETPEEMDEDLEEDRCYDDELVGRKVQGLYENRWFTGTISYFNQKIGRYLVSYKDGSTDLFDVSDFDDVELILM